MTNNQRFDYLQYFIWALIGLGIALIFSSCAQPRYDANGNGTRPQDKLTRWAVHKVNGEGY